ncbi:MAG: DUF1015 domain-containing protein [Jatrophihabitans sp.]|uniref:DUF1015 domain-containing protein n=1 Tax=Jatrophihabitans sp. TaxID=1932789 RepID=UPI003F7D9A27
MVTAHPGHPDRSVTTAGLSLAPMRGLRPTVTGDALGRRLCPPYDVISPSDRARLLDADPDNVVRIILPTDTTAAGDAYASAAATLREWVDCGVFAVDDVPAIYVYEMAPADGHPTRGLIGAVELRAPEDGVILPHENTMAGPVADRLALMTATEADLEPIYLVYDGGGAASELVRSTGSRPALAETTTPDGVRHRLWALTDPRDHEAIARDLAGRRALIADGHHRYATYRERQRRLAEMRGRGPWDRGLALLVDSTDYGPQVHPIHRVVPSLALQDAADRLRAAGAVVEDAADVAAGLAALDGATTFAAVVTDGERTVVVRDADGRLEAAARELGGSAALAALDVTVLHRAVIGTAWGLPDTVETVGYAHSVDDAVSEARAGHGVAVLLRATPVAAVAAVAADGERMPRKSTLFTPKPASGLLMRRFLDQAEDADVDA